MKTWHMVLAFLLMLAFALPALAQAPFEYPEGTLYRGITGYRDEVEFLQYQLFYGGYLGDDVSEVDGVFGKKTEAAVKQFQKDHGIDVTGIVCPNTQTALDREWEASMEPQGGEELPSHGIAEFCFEENVTVETLQTAITCRLEEMNSLYGEWMTQRPGQAELIARVQAEFMDFYRANLALWNVQLGSPSVEALTKAYDMLTDHNVQLCCTLDE